MKKRKPSLVDQPLTSYDTYEIGELPPKPTCGCNKASVEAAPVILQQKVTVEKALGVMGERMEAVAENVSSIGAGAGEVEACESGKKCTPSFIIKKSPDFEKCIAAAKAFGPIKDSDRLYDYLRQHTDMCIEDQEVLMVVSFDTHLYVRGVTEVSRGARDRVSVPIPDVLRSVLGAVIENGATAFAIVHNHPSGSPQPSEADEHLTKSVLKAAETIEIGLFDHIVAGANSYYSFRANKWKRNGKATKRP